MDKTTGFRWLSSQKMRKRHACAIFGNLCAFAGLGGSGTRRAEQRCVWALLLLGLGIAMIFLQNGLGGGIMALCGKSPLYGIGWWA